MLLKGWEPTNWLFDFCIPFIASITVCLEGCLVVLFFLQTEAIGKLAFRGLCARFNRCVFCLWHNSYLFVVVDIDKKTWLNKRQTTSVSFFKPSLFILASREHTLSTGFFFFLSKGVFLSVCIQNIFADGFCKAQWSWKLFFFHPFPCVL